MQVVPGVSMGPLEVNTQLVLVKSVVADEQRYESVSRGC